MLAYEPCCQTKERLSRHEMNTQQNDHKPTPDRSRECFRPRTKRKLQELIWRRYFQTIPLKPTRFQLKYIIRWMELNVMHLKHIINPYSQRGNILYLIAKKFYNCWIKFLISPTMFCIKINIDSILLMHAACIFITQSSQNQH